MPRNIVGLDIGTSAVRAAQIKGHDPRTLIRFAQLSMPPGAIVNGEIAAPELVAGVIKELWRRGEFKSKKVAISVSNQNVIVRQIEIPYMEEKDLREALRFQVSDFIPMPIEQAQLDFIILDEFVSDDGAPMMRVLAIAALKSMVEEFVSVVQRAGLDPVSIDLSPLAAVRALVDSGMVVLGDREAEAIVDVGAGVTDVAIHEAGAPRLIRTIPSGGNLVTEALVAALGVTADEAEEQKGTASLQEEGAPVASEAARIIEQHAGAFIDDVRRSIEFYRSLPDSARVTRVVLTGGVSRLEGLAERLCVALDVPVVSGRALDRLAVGPLGLTDEQLDHVASVAAVAIGLALEE